MKIIIGGIQHETNTFSNVKTTVEAFELRGWDLGNTLIEKNRGIRNFIGGMVDKAEELELDIFPTFSVTATPSGIITTDTYEALKNALMGGVRQATDVDAVVLSLHGAGVAENTEDLEGSLLEEVRAAVGEDTPIIVTLDLHANMTPKMVDIADAILGNHLYPHTDSYEIGAEAVVLATEIFEEKVKPTMYLKQLPIMIPTSTTNLSPASDVNQLCYQWEDKEGVIDCTFYHGFPYTNISHLGVAVLVTTNNDPELAKQVANDVSSFIEEKKHEFIVEQPSPKEGIALALAHEGRPVVINETSDNPGAGTPADGTYLLREMLAANLTDACFGFMYDPEVAKIAAEAGVGATVEISLGGKTDDLHGEPIQLSAYVKAVTDGKFVQSSDMGKGELVNLGTSVRLQCNGVDIIVCSVKTQTLDDEVFLLHGIDIQHFKIVALKSSQHFRAGFEPISSKIITVDSPGLSTMDFTSFDYSNLKMEIFPLN